MSASTVKRAYKYRFYPTPEQEILLSRTFGCVRVVWNQTLEWRYKRWHDNQQGTSQSEAGYFLTSLKRSEEFKWLNEVSSVPLQQALRHQDKAFSGFFNKKSGYPKFKNRKSKQSFTLTRFGFRIKEGDIYIAKSQEPLNVVWSRSLPEGADPSSITISKDRANRHFVSILVEETVVHLPKKGANKDVGIDLGVSNFAALSTGEKIKAPKFGTDSAKKIAKLQRRLAKKENGSKNWEKARLKLAKAHARVADQRRDWLHKLSTRLVRENQTIYLEDLGVAGMSRSGGPHKRGLNRSINDASMAEFRGMIEYKAGWYGREVITINRWEPSTQICSDCGARTGPRGMNGLGIQSWICSECETLHDRDINAARNILAVGRAASVCGDGRRLGKTSVYQASVNEAENSRE